MSDPLVSVVIATRNRRAWLSEAVARVRAQAAVAFEILVVSKNPSRTNRSVPEPPARATDET